MKPLTILQTAVIGILLYYIPVFSDGVAVEQCKEKQVDSTMQQDTIVITGRIFVSGHEPFTVLAIEREDGSSVVLSAADSLYKKLWSYQDEIVECTGRFKSHPLYEKSFYVVGFQKHQ